MKKLILHPQMLFAGLLLCTVLLLPVVLGQSAGTAVFTTASWTDPIEEGVGPMRQLPAATLASWTDPIEESIGSWSSPAADGGDAVASWTDPLEEGVGPLELEPITI